MRPPGESLSARRCTDGSKQSQDRLAGRHDELAEQ